MTGQIAIKNNKKYYYGGDVTALYCRLSKEDECTTVRKTNSKFVKISKIKKVKEVYYTKEIEKIVKK